MSLFKVGVCMWEGAKPGPGAPPLPQWMYIQRLHYLQWFNITVTVYVWFYETIRADPNFLRGEYV